MSNRETSEDIASLAGRILNEEPREGDENLAFNALLVQAKKLAGSALSQREEPQAGTHAYDLLAEAEKHNVEVTDTLISMIAATVLAKLVEEEGGGRTNITFGPQDMDAMHRNYEMSVTRDGLLTTVRISPRSEMLKTHQVHDIIAGQAVETEASLMAQDEDTSGALPQAEAKEERPYWFFNSAGTGRQGPMPRDDAQALVYKSVDPTARIENRNCPKAECPNSDQQGSCPACTPL